MALFHIGLEVCQPAALRPVRVCQFGHAIEQFSLESEFHEVEGYFQVEIDNLLVVVHAFISGIFSSSHISSCVRDHLAIHNTISRSTEWYKAVSAYIYFKKDDVVRMLPWTK